MGKNMKSKRKYQRKVWQRGPGDWCWMVRDITDFEEPYFMVTSFADGTKAESRPKAHLAVIHAIEARERHLNAQWKNVR